MAYAPVAEINVVASSSSTYRRIYSVVSRIPRGRVATYGQVASLAGLPRRPRLVGYALNILPESSRVPWHRVVNAKGQISVRSNGFGHEILQRLLLEREGVRFDAHQTIALLSFQWRPRQPRSFGMPATLQRRER